MKKTADNLVDINESNLSKYKKLKDGEDIRSGDLVHIYDETYAELSNGHLLTKEKVNKHNTILRKK